MNANYLTIYDTTGQPGIVSPSAILELVADLDSVGVYILSGGLGENPNVQFELNNGKVVVGLWGKSGDEPELKVQYDERNDRWLVLGKSR